MSTTPEPTPSAGAVRAAEKIHSALLTAKALTGFDPNLTFGILGAMAEIIDWETRAGRLAEALLSALTRIHNGITRVQIAEEIEKALAEYKSTNQTP